MHYFHFFCKVLGLKNINFLEFVKKSPTTGQEKILDTNHKFKMSKSFKNFLEIVKNYILNCDVLLKFPFLREKISFRRKFKLTNSNKILHLDV